MTENKRFRLAYEKGNWWAVRDGDITLWKEEVIHLLNELNDENQKLDEKICSLTMDLIKTKSYEQLEKELNRIKNENEQLKQQLRNSVELFRKDSVTLFELKEENKELKVNYKELRYANNIYCNKIDSLKKENEQLKQQLNELGE